MAVLTVCSSGCDYTTLAAAISAAAAVDEIDIQENIDEDIALNKNIASIFSSNGSTWSNSANFQLLYIQAGLTQTLTFHDITLLKQEMLNYFICQIMPVARHLLLMIVF